jgi:uncharacterized protein
MRILFDIGHPADVHLFKHTIRICQQNGHKIKIVCRPRDNVIELLQRYGFTFESIGHFDHLWQKALGMFLIDFNLYRICKRFRPELLVSFGSPYSAHIGHWFHIPSVTMVDTEPEPFTLFHWESRIVFQLFVKKIFVPNSYKRKFLAPRVVRFAGFKELA